MDLLHKNLDNFLIEIECPFTIEEVYGYLTGFASSSVQYSEYHDGLMIYFLNEQTHSGNNINTDIVKDNISYITRALENNSFVFPFDSSINSIQRLINLSGWSKNYVLSINYLIEKKLLSNTLNIQEIIHDLTEISKLEDKYNLDNSAENSDYYDEISDYVISSMYYIYMESKKFKNNV